MSKITVKNIITHWLLAAAFACIFCALWSGASVVIVKAQQTAIVSSLQVGK